MRRTLTKYGFFLLTALTFTGLAALSLVGQVAFSEPLTAVEPGPDGVRRCPSVEIDAIRPAPRVIAYEADDDQTSNQPVLRIPVLVRVLHNGEPVGSAPNIPDAQIESQIQVLNVVKFAAPDNGILGYAQFPEASGLDGLRESGEVAATARVVIRDQSIGSSDADDGSILLGSPYDLGPHRYTSGRPLGWACATFGAMAYAATRRPFRSLAVIARLMTVGADTPNADRAN